MIRLVDVHKDFPVGDREVRAIDGVSFEVAGGSLVALMGRSGCGKSTLLHLVAGLERPSQGQIFLEDRSLSDFSEPALTELRRTRVGIVFQFFNLLPTLNAVENVMFPLILRHERYAEARKRADRLLETVGMAHRSEYRMHQLSGGEQQRIALARALIHEPAVILADEPTGNLDSESSERVLSFMWDLPRKAGATVLLATHSSEIAAMADRVITLKDGKVVEDRQNHGGIKS